MVEKIVEYACGWTGCEARYPTRQKAQSCEDRGMIEPDITPGLLLGGGSGGVGYSIVTRSNPRGHVIYQYSLVRILTDLDDLRRIEAEFTGDSSDETPGWRTEEHRGVTLVTFFRRGQIRLLDEIEFLSVRELLRSGKSLGYHRHNLGGVEQSDLYRERPDLAKLVRNH